MQAVARLNERAEAYSRLKRYEEPMEISMLNPPQVTPSSPHDGLQKQMEKLSTKLAKIEASTRSNQANWRGDTQTLNNNGRRVDTRRVDTRVNPRIAPPPPLMTQHTRAPINRNYTGPRPGALPGICQAIFVYRYQYKIKKTESE